MSPNVRVAAHPLVSAHLTRLRDRRTPREAFHRSVVEMARLLAYEASRDVRMRHVSVVTPFEAAQGEVPERRLTVVVVLRSGLAMAEGVLALDPEARVGHVGVQRNERTLEPMPYYLKLPPDLDRDRVLVVDPMLATGGTMCHTVSLLKEHGAQDLRALCIVTAPPGLDRLAREHPDVVVHAGSVDRGLDADGRVRPGIGDAGDRLYGTA